MEEKERRLEKALRETMRDAVRRKEPPDVSERARDLIIPPYEIRIQAERDPIAEETKIIRRMVKEPDGKYDKYAEPEDK